MNTTTSLNLNSMTPQEAAFAGTMLSTILIIGLAIGVILLIAGWRIFDKAGEKGWKILIPIYDIYILFKICNAKNWFWFYLCAIIVTSIMMSVNAPVNVPVIEDWSGIHPDYSAINIGDYPIYFAGTILSCVVSIVAEAYIAFRLAKAFGKGVWYGIGIFFFPYIFAMILGFGKAKYSSKLLK